MMTFIDPSGEENAAEAEIGKHLLDVAHDNNIELEGKKSRTSRVSNISLFLVLGRA
jgi:hypothetical protein